MKEIIKQGKEADDLPINTIETTRDKIPYAIQWVSQIQDATNQRVSDYSAYIKRVDILAITLLKKERTKVRQYQTLLEQELVNQCGANPSLKNILRLYDTLLEYIIDVLEEAGYLTDTSRISLGGE